MGNDLIKQDINFLEYPLWMQNERSGEATVWTDREGYTYRTGYKPPIKTDFVFLLYILMRSQSENWSEDITLTRYEILEGCGLRKDKWWYERLKDSLKRWTNVTLEFQGTFYDGHNYLELNFGVIDDWDIREDTKKLHIRISPKWLLRIRKSDFFKLLNFKHVKQLRSPLTVRLYEILIKNFQNRTKWEIDSLKLAQKIPMQEGQPSHIIPKIQAAVNRISNHSDLNIKLTVKRPARGKAILMFEKLPASKTERLSQPQSPAPDHSEDSHLKTLMDLLPQEHQKKKTILNEISHAFKKHGFSFVSRNIKYTNNNSNGNYRAYLHQAMKNDWGLALEEDEKIKREQQQKIQKENQRQEQKVENTKKEIDLAIKAQEYINSLSPEKVDTLKNEAIEKMTPNMVKLLESGNAIGQSNLRGIMQKIVMDKGLVGE